MDFWTDIAFAVILRVLKDRRMREQYRRPMKKILAILLEWLESDVEVKDGKLTLKS